MNNESVVWIEKYRPTEFEEVCGRDKIVKRLVKYVETGNMPHLLFSGMRGTGKTTMAIIIGKKLFGETFDSNFTELNASDARGIDVIRGTVANIAETQPEGEHDCKIIFLDEVDALTPDAQNALKRTMEKNTDNCRFILSCNHSSKLIPEIQSRCAVYRFGLLDNKAITEMVKYVAKHEKVKLINEGIEALVYVAGGDMRKAINTLQDASVFDNKITGETVYAVAGYANPEFIEKMVDLAFKGKFLEAKNKLDILLIEEGFSGDDVVYQVHKQLLNMALPNKLMLEMVSITGEIDFRVTEGANDKIQLDCLLALFAKIGNGFK